MTDRELDDVREFIRNNLSIALDKNCFRASGDETLMVKLQLWTPKGPETISEASVLLVAGDD